MMLLEFRFALFGDNEAFYMVLTDDKLSLDALNSIEDAISSHTESIDKLEPETLIHDVLESFAIPYRVIPFGRTYHI